MKCFPLVVSSVSILTILCLCLSVHSRLFILCMLLFSWYATFSKPNGATVSLAVSCKIFDWNWLLSKSPTIKSLHTAWVYAVHPELPGSWDKALILMIVLPLLPGFAIGDFILVGYLQVVGKLKFVLQSHTSFFSSFDWSILDFLLTHVTNVL